MALILQWNTENHKQFDLLRRSSKRRFTFADEIANLWLPSVRAPIPSISGAAGKAVACRSGPQHSYAPRAVESSEDVEIPVSPRKNLQMLECHSRKLADGLPIGEDITAKICAADRVFFFRNRLFIRCRRLDAPTAFSMVISLASSHQRASQTLLCRIVTNHDQAFEDRQKTASFMPRNPDFASLKYALIRISRFEAICRLIGLPMIVRVILLRQESRRLTLNGITLTSNF